MKSAYQAADAISSEEAQELEAWSLEEMDDAELDSAREFVETLAAASHSWDG